MMEVKGKENVVFRKPPDAGILTDRRKIMTLHCEVNGVHYTCKAAAYKAETDMWMLAGAKKYEGDNSDNG